MYIHGDIETWYLLLLLGLAQPRPLMQPHRTRSNAEHCTHIKLTVHVCQTFLTCHRTRKFVFVLLLSSFPEIPVNMFVFRECVGGRECKMVRKAVWLKGCIDRFESTGTNSIAWPNIMVIKLKVGCKHRFVSTWVHHECLCGCVVWYMLVSGGVFPPYSVFACSESR